MAKKNSKKPRKPYADFPLYAHAAGVWAKKIRGKVHYFGPWHDWQGALENYLAQKDFLHLGRPAPPPQDTVADLLNQFIGGKKQNLEIGDITPSTYKEYIATCDAIHEFFGRSRPLDSLSVPDFQGLRTALAQGETKTLSPVTHKRRLTIARMVFAGSPFLKALNAPSSRVLRAARRAKGERLYTAEEIRSLVEHAESEMKGMILLGINCGFGPKDCCTLPTEYADLENGWQTYPRPKTEVMRRCPLWPETIEALAAVAERPLVFNGRVWNRHVVAREFNKVCGAAGVETQGHYTLRRTFETIATTADVPQAVIDTIQGHLRNDMASIYRQRVFNEQLTKCVEHVRGWYLGTIRIE